MPKNVRGFGLRCWRTSRTEGSWLANIFYRYLKMRKRSGSRSRKCFESRKCSRRLAYEEELEAYNPLIPDGDNWKCSMLIQYPDVEERRQRLAELLDVENRVWVQAGETEKLFALADEDLERANDAKTSAVHFLRFQLGAAQVSDVKDDAAITFGIDHKNYQEQDVLVSEGVRTSLAADLS